MLGYSAGSSCQDYRFFLMDMEHDYNVTVEHNPSYENVTLYFKLMEDTNSAPPRIGDLEGKSNNTTHWLEIDEALRQNESAWPKSCEKSFRSLQ